MLERKDSGPTLSKPVFVVFGVINDTGNIGGPCNETARRKMRLFDLYWKEEKS